MTGGVRVLAYLPGALIMRPTSQTPGSGGANRAHACVVTSRFNSTARLHPTCTPHVTAESAREHHWRLRQA